jgi:arginyl-tRNA synthetase
MIEQRLSDLLAEALSGALGDLGVEAAEVPIELSRPRQKEFGDFSTNVALVLGARTDVAPRRLAERIVARLPSTGLIVKAEVAGPGFINLHVSEGWLRDVLREVAERGEDYGRAEPHGRSVQVEFVSANPTGPLHVGHARNAALGDALARLLEAAGWRVEREYYFNDAGGQMDRFAQSVEARYLELLGREAEVPEDGYHGEYVTDIARDILDAEGPALADTPPEERMPRIRELGVQRVLDQTARTLERFGVRFDVYISERELAQSGEIEAAVKRLRESGHAYDSEGAIWFRSTDFGDDKDRVIIRSTGAHTYFGADCAYLIDKFRRGFDHVIYVWGADHHGDVARVRGAASALGFDPESVEMVIYQFVSFLRAGEPVPMSKRAGTFISLDELIDEVGADAARFTLLSHSNDSTMSFDIELVKQQSMENPVYYVQYGHARIASILRNAAERRIELRPIDEVNLDLLGEESELELVRSISEFPALTTAAAAARAPYRLTHFSQELAARFHRFYTECRVISDDAKLTQARLWVCVAAKRVIANALGLLGVSAPESMERIDG